MKALVDTGLIARRRAYIAELGALYYNDGYEDGAVNTDLEPDDIRGLTAIGVARRERAMVAAAVSDRQHPPGAWTSALEAAITPGEARKLFRRYLTGYEDGVRRQVTLMLDPDGRAARARSRYNKDEEAREMRRRRLGLKDPSWPIPWLRREPMTTCPAAAATTATPPVLCPAIQRRVKFDEAHGRTTSEAQKDFIQRTHQNCDACEAWRRERLVATARRANG